MNNWNNLKECIETAVYFLWFVAEDWGVPPELNSVIKGLEWAIRYKPDNIDMYRASILMVEDNLDALDKKAKYAKHMNLDGLSHAINGIIRIIEPTWRICLTDLLDNSILHGKVKLKGGNNNERYRTGRDSESSVSQGRNPPRDGGKARYQWGPD